MVKHNLCTNKQILSLTVIRDLAESCRLEHRIPATGTNGRIFVRRIIATIAEAFSQTGVVKLDRPPRQANGPKYVASASSNAFQRHDWLIKQQPNRILPIQVVDPVRLRLDKRLENTSEIMQAN